MPRVANGILKNRIFENNPISEKENWFFKKKKLFGVSSKNVSPFGPAVWLAIAHTHIYISE